VGSAPVVAGDGAAAVGGLAGAGHGECVVGGAGGVVVGELLVGGDVAAGGEFVDVGPPEVRVAAVVAVADGASGRQHEVLGLGDGDGVDVGVVGVGGCGREQVVEF